MYSFTFQINRPMIKMDHSEKKITGHYSTVKRPLILSLIIVVVSFSCINSEKKNNQQIYQEIDFIGNWTATDKKILENAEPGTVQSFSLKQDSTAEIRLTDRMGYRIVYGKWGNRRNFKIFNQSLSLKADLMLEFDREKNHLFRVNPV